MILEVADIRIHPGQQAAFDEAIQRGLATVISKSRGYQGHKVNKGVAAGEKVVVDGLLKVRPGEKVDPKPLPAEPQVAKTK